MTPEEYEEWKFKEMISKLSLRVGTNYRENSCGGSYKEVKISLLYEDKEITSDSFSVDDSN